MNTHSHSTHLEELDLVIPDMEGQEMEERVRSVLSGIPGVHSALIIPEGALIKYEPGKVTKEVLCTALNTAGFRTDLFQDSASGEAHNVSQQ